MPLAALAIARRLWPYAAVALAIIAAGLWHRGQLADARKEGVAAERASWERETARLRAIAAEEAAARQAAVDSAMTADVERDAALRRLLAPINDKVNGYAQTAPGRAVCLAGDGRMLAQAAIDAANASIASGAGARR